MNGEKKSTVIAVRVPENLVQKLDAWTKLQPAVLARAEALMCLAEIGLNIAEVTRKRIGDESPMALELTGLAANRIVARQKSTQKDK